MVQKTINYFEKFARPERVYIMPSKLGNTFVFINFTIFMVGIIYANNMALLLAFTLGAYFVVTMFTSHNVLMRNSLRLISFNDVFMNQEYKLRVELTRNINVQVSFKTNLGWVGKIAHLSGTQLVERVCVTSYYPNNLFRVWKYFDVDHKIYIYPVPLEFQKNKLVGTKEREYSGVKEDFLEYFKYSYGMSAKRIDWKKYAAQDKLLWKKNQSLDQLSYIYDIEKMPGLKDEKARYMSHLLTTSLKHNKVWGVIIGDYKSEVLTGERHYKECMRQLCEYL